MLISFAYTTAAFLSRAKTCTRRNWNDSYAQKYIKAYEKGEPVDAWDKLPRSGGQPVGKIRLTESPYKELTGFMTEQDYIDEGFAWMEQNNIKIRGIHPRSYFEQWKQADENVWVVRFDIISLEV